MEVITASSEEDERAIKGRLTLLAEEIARHRAEREEAKRELVNFGRAVCFFLRAPLWQQKSNLFVVVVVVVH